MKRVKGRANAALLLSALIIFGLGVYILRFAADGAQWASASFNSSVYASGVIKNCTVTDRNGVTLIKTEDGQRSYADDAAVRKACLHVTGDFTGNIGTGAISVFSDELIGYNPVTGLYSAPGGGTLALTVDSALCVTAYEALAGRKGAVLVYNYETGEVLCSVSSGSYDPAEGIPDLTDSANEGVFINRAISAAYTPGSVFKVVTMAAAIEEIPDLFTRRFSCGGSVEISGSTVKCSGTHGTQTVEQALANSCNCAFAEISLELGPAVLEQYSGMLGITLPHSLSGIATAAGSFERAEAGSAALAWSGIGQHNDLVCPYAMMRLMGVIAAGGSGSEPTLISGRSSGSYSILSKDTAQTLKELLMNNVTAAYGSWNFPGLNIGAKSGTAEVGDGTSHSWFAGFLDSGDNPLAFAVVIEHGGSGLANAGAVANTVLQAAVK